MHLSNRQPSKRNRSLAMVAGPRAQEPHFAMLLHAEARDREADSDGAATEPLDFSHRRDPAVRSLAFASRFSTFAKFARLDAAGIFFVTFRRRWTRLEDRARSLLHSALSDAVAGCTRTVSVCDKYSRLAAGRSRRSSPSSSPSS